MIKRSLNSSIRCWIIKVHVAGNVLWHGMTRYAGSQVLLYVGGRHTAVLLRNCISTILSVCWHSMFNLCCCNIQIHLMIDIVTDIRMSHVDHSYESWYMELHIPYCSEVENGDAKVFFLYILDNHLFVIPKLSFFNFLYILFGNIICQVDHFLGCW